MKLVDHNKNENSCGQTEMKFRLHLHRKHGKKLILCSSQSNYNNNYYYYIQDSKDFLYVSLKTFDSTQYLESFCRSKEFKKKRKMKYRDRASHAMSRISPI
jgi:hypothetical protein